MKDISAGLDAEVPEGPEGKANLMKVCHQSNMEYAPNELWKTSLLSIQMG